VYTAVVLCAECKHDCASLVGETFGPICEPPRPTAPSTESVHRSHDRIM
jgi:hypothetical protein